MTPDARPVTDKAVQFDAQHKHVIVEIPPAGFAWFPDGSASQTCAVKEADDVERVRSGDQVEMTCSQLAGVWTLTRVRKK